MSTQLLLVKPPVAPTPANAQPSPLWMITSVGLALLLIGLAVFSKLQQQKLEKKLRFERFRAREITNKLKLALETIRTIETNPDLVNSRDINLDYIRMRMEEETFHTTIVSQIKAKVKAKISQALRPSLAQQGVVGDASQGRQVNQVFDVDYGTGGSVKQNRRVLFRIHIRLMKLPAQTTSITLTEIIDCIKNYLSPPEDNDTWQPTIQGRVIYMHWDQKAKPTPMLIIEQSNEGVNVSFRTNRQELPANPLSSKKSKSNLGSK